jgi:cyclic dehypoxanthinyl futalosine synthase
VEENVLQQAGHQRATTLDDVLTIIRRAGFTPAQRDSFYTVLRVFDAPAPAGAAA